MNNRDLCIFCKHFYLEIGGPAWSDDTPGDETKVFCQEGKWSLGIDDDHATYRKKIRMAKDCPLFEMAKDDE